MTTYTKQQIILFDGVCKLCHAWVKFILRFDKQKIFKLCSVQSRQGKAILEGFGYSTESFNTMLYVDSAQCFEKSRAFFEIISRLGYPWKLILIFKIIPRSLADWLYDRIARNRYRLFGRYEYCILPLADHKDRFIDGE